MRCKLNMRFQDNLDFGSFGLILSYCFHPNVRHIVIAGDSSSTNEPFIVSGKESRKPDCAAEAFGTFYNSIQYCKILLYWS